METPGYSFNAHANRFNVILHKHPFVDASKVSNRMINNSNCSRFIKNSIEKTLQLKTKQ